MNYRNRQELELHHRGPQAPPSIQTLAELLELYRCGSETAFLRWANQQHVNALKRFLRENGIDFPGRKTKVKMLTTLRTLISLTI